MRKNKVLILLGFLSLLLLFFLSGCGGSGGGNSTPLATVTPIVTSTPIATPTPTTTIYTIGNTGPAGGIIFYDKGNYSAGWRYLEAAPSDQCNKITWCNGTTSTNCCAIGLTNTAIGTGAANTAAIVDIQGTGSYAAYICDKLVLGGKSDWFLPSKDELNEMYQNLHANGLGHFNCTWYWSSSEYSYYEAWIQIFEYGGQGGYAKYDIIHEPSGVRAVRAF